MDIKGVFRGEYIIEYRCSGCMLDAAVENYVLFIAAFNFVIGVAVDTVISRVY